MSYTDIGRKYRIDPRTAKRFPADEVIWAMMQIGDSMSGSLLETTEGGLASSKTGRDLDATIMAV